jgi:cyclomaltodextrinase
MGGEPDHDPVADGLQRRSQAVWSGGCGRQGAIAFLLVATAFSDTPAWVADAVFYQIFPDRFARSNRVSKDRNLEAWDATPTHHGFKGGDLGGVMEHLDYLEDLGVNAILFNPIFQSASNHRYHTHDYYKIDPLLGDEALFDEMLAACHDRGIRVVLDGVFNHCSRGFFQFNDIVENRGQSPYIDWFNVRKFPIYPYHPSQRRYPRYEAWYGLPALPEFDTTKPAVREFLFGVVEFWTRKGIDGWRLDVASEIATPGFWQEFRRRVRAINPDAYIVAEIWKDSSAWINDREQFDGTMNYLYTGAVLAFAGGDRVDTTTVFDQPWPVTPPMDAAQFAAAVDHVRSIYNDQATLGNLNVFASHDTARALTIVGGDEDSVVLTILLCMTFPGAAHVYYGEELGLRGHKEPLSRNAVPWDKPDSWNDRIGRTYKELIALRRSQPSLRSLPYRTLVAQGDVYAVERGEGDRTVVVANVGSAAASLRLDVAGTMSALWGSAAVDGAEVTVPARSGAVLAMT